MLRENVTKPVRSDSTSCPPAERRGERFAHDDGNVLTDDSGRREFTWDAENRLIQVKPGTGYEYPGAKCVQFAYDYRGRRVWKEARTWSNGQWQSPTAAQQRRYLWDGGKLLEEFNASSMVLRKYTWGLDLAGLSGSVNSLEGAGTVGGLLAHHDTALATARDFVYLYDGNGNVGQVVEPATATIYAKHEYDPFGGYRFSSQSGLYYPDYSFTFQFSTKQFDVETNFGYWGERYYLPEYGRWASQDPIGDGGGANLYGFVGNDPTDRYDPFGQCGPPLCAIYTTEVGANGSSSASTPASPMPLALVCLLQEAKPGDKPQLEPESTPCGKALAAALKDPRVVDMEKTLGKCWKKPRCGTESECKGITGGAEGPGVVVSGGRTTGQDVVMCGDFDVETLLHELIHVRDNCKLGKNGEPVITTPNDTDFACREIRAIVCSGECDHLDVADPQTYNRDKCIQDKCLTHTVQACKYQQSSNPKACEGKTGKDLEAWAKGQCDTAYKEKDKSRCAGCSGLPPGVRGQGGGGE
jgi:RHS repeat-associated protein